MIEPRSLGQPEMIMSRTAALLASSLALAGGLRAQGVTPLVQKGDVVTGVGTVTRIDNLAVNDDGSWIVEADTDHPNFDMDGVLRSLACRPDPRSQDMQVLDAQPHRCYGPREARRLGPPVFKSSAPARLRARHRGQKPLGCRAASSAKLR